MESFNRTVSKALILLIGSLFFTSACSLLGLDSEDDDTTLLLAALALNRGYSLDSSTNCIVGQSSSMDASLPPWIKDNFKCSVGTMDGSNYVFTTLNLPNTKSYYYGTASSLYEDLPSGNTPAGNNVIGAQNFVYTIPGSPTVNGGAKTSTQGGLPSIGLTVNGLAIFNNAAAPGDTLATEAGTFDKYNGHPQESSVYHHHANPLNITSTSGDSNLVGIALDGYPIYGLYCDQATASTADDAAPGIGTPALDAYHGHAANTVLFPGGIYHYHYAYDSTATINTLMGSFFNGNIGTVTN
ncbi:MAG: YHYH protein [Leptospiraceae bacterium]|nr:YHYH protein [Leptospiraceae bacterium]